MWLLSGPIKFLWVTSTYVSPINIDIDIVFDNKYYNSFIECMMQLLMSVK